MTKQKNKKAEQTIPPRIADGQSSLIWSFLSGFTWLNNSLQESLKAHGWPSVSVTESQILILAALGVTRPTDVASSLGISKQAINKACKKLLDAELIKLVTDPEDRRSKIIHFNEDKLDIHLEAQRITNELEREFATRMGGRQMQQFMSMMNKGLGEVHIVEDKSKT